MAKYPVEFNDQTGLVDSVNYLLAGAQSLGQSVNGVIGNTTGLQTGNNVLPFTATTASLYITESVATVDWLDDYTLKFTFTTPGAVPYFALGQSLTASGTSVTEYNVVYDSVVETTTTYVVVKTATSIPNLGSATGGTITLEAGLTAAFKYLHTDCFGIAVIAGGFDNAVISAQIKNTIQYITTDVTTLVYTAAINRYKLTATGIVFDATVASQTNNIVIASATTDYDTSTVYFTAVKDKPLPGSYVYFLDTSYYDSTGATIVLSAEFNYRSLTAQVIKE